MVKQRETIKLEIEVDKNKDYWDVLAYLNNQRFVRGAFYTSESGVLEINVNKDLTKEAIFELGFNAALKLNK